MAEVCDITSVFCTLYRTVPYYDGFCFWTDQDSDSGLVLHAKGVGFFCFSTQGVTRRTHAKQYT